MTAGLEVLGIILGSLVFLFVFIAVGMIGCWCLLKLADWLP